MVSDARCEKCGALVAAIWGECRRTGCPHFISRCTTSQPCLPECDGKTCARYSSSSATSDEDLPGMLAVAKGIAEQKFPHTMDAAVWAAEFVKLNPGADEGLMLSWFANAIMAGYDTAASRLASVERYGPHESPPKTRAEKEAADITEEQEDYRHGLECARTVIRTTMRAIETKSLDELNYDPPSTDYCISAGLEAINKAISLGSSTTESSPEAMWQRFVDYLATAEPIGPRENPNVEHKAFLGSVHWYRTRFMEANRTIHSAKRAPSELMDVLPEAKMYPPSTQTKVP